MNEKDNKYLGNCHCGKIKFLFYCKDQVEILVCNCSICTPTNYYHLIVPHTKFKLIKGKKYLKEYVFETKKAKHLFCTNCGIKSYYQPRSHKDSYSININCVNNPPIIKKFIKFNGKDFDAAMKKLEK